MCYLQLSASRLCTKVFVIHSFLLKGLHHECVLFKAFCLKSLLHGCILFTAFCLKGLHHGYVLFTAFWLKGLHHGYLLFTAFCLKGLHHGQVLFTTFCLKGYPLSMLICIEFFPAQELHPRRLISKVSWSKISSFRRCQLYKQLSLSTTAFCLQDLRSEYVNMYYQQLSA